MEGDVAAAFASLEPGKAMKDLIDHARQQSRMLEKLEEARKKIENDPNTEKFTQNLLRRCRTLAKFLMASGKSSRFFQELQKLTRIQIVFISISFTEAKYGHDEWNSLRAEYIRAYFETHNVEEKICNFLNLYKRSERIEGIASRYKLWGSLVGGSAGTELPSGGINDGSSVAIVEDLPEQEIPSEQVAAMGNDLEAVPTDHRPPKHIWWLPKKQNVQNCFSPADMKIMSVVDNWTDMETTLSVWGRYFEDGTNLEIVVDLPEKRDMDALHDPRWKAEIQCRYQMVLKLDWGGFALAMVNELFRSPDKRALLN